MKDLRINKLAHMLVNYSVSVKKGEKVLIEGTDAPPEILTALIAEVYAAGGLPFVETFSPKVQRALYRGTDEKHMSLTAKYASCRMSEMDCYIGVRGASNSYEMSDVPSDKMSIYSRAYFHPVHHELRVSKTKWVGLRYPNEAMSQLAAMSTEAFEDFYFDVCTMDYSKMDKAMDALVALMQRTDKVRLVAPETDIAFSIKGIPAVKCSGRRNIPDGEVYTAPVAGSINGVIKYNTPSVSGGEKFENIKLVFEKGRIVESYGNKPDKLKAIFDTDEGARGVGEFAIGVNPYITNPMGDILFDEKIAGSIHFTPGCCYDEAPNGNKSAVHWDLVLMMDAAHGGGEIWFDDILIRKDGIFVIKELECLNPENLKH